MASSYASRQRSTAGALAWAYAALVLYASLYPFEGWRWPEGAGSIALLQLPWLPYGDEFDLWSNVLGYLPFGALLALAQLRNGRSLRRAAAVGVLLPALFSYSLEVAQVGLPVRHPSLKDWLLNVGGASLGVATAALVQALGGVDRWHRLRDEWFAPDAAPALALLWLWPVGLLIPAPVPLGLGQFDGRVQAVLAGAFAQLPGLEGLGQWLAAPAAPAARLSIAAETALMALGLLAPCLLAYSIVAPGARRLAMAFGAVALAAAAMTLSTWLNFGPRHALAWITPWAGPAVGIAALIALVLAPMRRALVLGVGLMVLTGLVIGVARAPPDPYFAHALAAWEQGRFVRFHGVSQWVGWLWPYAAMLWLLSRLATRP